LTDVYATARPGLRSRLGSRLAAQARARRHERFRALTGAGEGTRILDVGCGALGLRALEPGLDITGTDLAARPDYPGPFVQADATDRLPFDDGAFDLAYSSSVIEHVAPERRAAFAREVRRVARGWWVQTPAYSFPVEPHALLPPPTGCRRRSAGPTGAWASPASGRTSRSCAAASSRPSSAPLSPSASGPLAKSWISVHTPVTHAR
jgi:SAM-dependent methyltransferase